MSNATKPVASFRELKVFYPRDRSLDKYEDDTALVLLSTYETLEAKLKCQVKNTQELHFENLELTQRNQELELALESFKTARIMADPSDIKEYIHNHEVAHKALPMNREK